MSRSASPKRVPPAFALPDDLIHVIFSKLDFPEKVIAGIVCKKWEQLLKTGRAAGKHWVVEYSLDKIVWNTESAVRYMIPKVEEIEMTFIERYDCHINLSHSDLRENSPRTSSQGEQLIPCRL
jgi:hypothetical protein